MDEYAIKIVVGYFLIGILVTIGFWQYLERTDPAPVKPMSPQTTAEKIVITTLMLVLMSATWIVLYPALILLAANSKNQPPYDPKDDYR